MTSHTVTEDPATEGLDCYLVGGAVRDTLMDFPFHERDWVVVGATESIMLARGFHRVGRDFPVFLHPETAEEYALARTERKSGRGYTGFVVNASPDVTLEEDLARRDLTINAIAKAPDNTLVDPFSGRSDIQHKVLRHIGSAFMEDPLRILRLARFYARYAHLGFSVADETLALVCQMASRGELKELAAERVWKETEKALHEKTPAAYFSLLYHNNALFPWFEELNGEDIFTSALARLKCAVDAGIAPVDQRFALLMLDVDSQAQREMAQRLRLPIAIYDAMRLLRVSHEMLSKFSRLPLEEQARELLSWCQEMDRWRRPERIEKLLPSLKFILPELPWSNVIEAIDLATQVSPKQWEGCSLKGKEIGQRLQKERLLTIRQALESDAAK